MNDAPAVEALAIVAPHRVDGVWPCRRWVVICLPCEGTSLCFFHEPGPAVDAAREHLAAMHGIAVIPTTSRSTP